METKIEGPIEKHDAVPKRKGSLTESMLRNSLSAIALAGALMGPAHLWAQQGPIQTHQEVQTQTKHESAQNKKPAITGTFFNTTTVPETPLAQGNQWVSRATVNLSPNTALQFAGTQINKFNPTTTQYSWGLSGEYFKNDKPKDPSWIQGAVLRDYGASATSADVNSAALDWSWRVANFSSKANVNLLGNFGSVDRSGDKNAHNDVAGGVKFNFLGDSNVIAEYSHYGINKAASTADGLRLGYEWNNNTNLLAAFLLDKQMGEKHAYTVLFGSPHVRFIGGFDPNKNKNQTERVYQTQLYLSWGGLSAYTITGQLAGVFAETRVSSGTTAGIPGSSYGVPNANNTYLASGPQVYYLTSATKQSSRFGDFFRGKVNQNPITDKKPYYKDQDFANVSLLRTGKGSGVIVGENFTLDSSGTWHKGGGLGYELPWLNATLFGTYQTNNYRTVTLTFKF